MTPPRKPKVDDDRSVIDSTATKPGAVTRVPARPFDVVTAMEASERVRNQKRQSLGMMNTHVSGRDCDGANDSGDPDADLSASVTPEQLLEQSTDAAELPSWAAGSSAWGLDAHSTGSFA